LRDSFDDLNVIDEGVSSKKEINMQILNSNIRHASIKKEKFES